MKLIHAAARRFCRPPGCLSFAERTTDSWGSPSGNPSHPRYARCRCVYRPLFEALESRLAPASFTVTTTMDTVAADLNTGLDANGNISLRSAIQAANHLGGSNSIDLPAGNYALTITGSGEDNSASGDLDIKNDLTIVGADAATTIVAARAPGSPGTYLGDRVLEIFAGSNVTISNVTIRDGQGSPSGGGVFNAGILRLTSDVITGNTAFGAAATNGADGSAGQAGGNGSAGGDGLGGGIFNAQSANLTIIGSTIAGNIAVGARGGNGGNGGNGGAAIGVGGSGHSGGDAGPGGAGRGGGIYNDSGASTGVVTIMDSLISGNSALGGFGGFGGNGSPGAVGSSGSNGTAGSNGGNGGSGGNGGDAGAGGIGGNAEGGGIYGAGIVIRNSAITDNHAWVGTGNPGFDGFSGYGGKAGAGGDGGPGGRGGNVTNGTGGVGGAGGAAGNAGAVHDAAPGGASFGGGIYALGASTIQNCTIANNEARGGIRGELSKRGGAVRPPQVPAAARAAKAAMAALPLTATAAPAVLVDRAATDHWARRERQRSLLPNRVPATEAEFLRATRR